MLRWKATTDRSGIPEYRVARAGKVVSQLVRGTALAVPKARSKGARVVYALDVADNVSRPSATLRVR